ncbi:ethylene-responsive transcription factor Related to AP22-7-like [Forsythia ovata]|uniref:Ethylene-responsive transcription factor Related to AP22-7-like n=1 Tax=Forsythia ovata TaxID=205694 RepID=A0ABD1RPC4_9LAMI
MLDLNLTIDPNGSIFDRIETVLEEQIKLGKGQMENSDNSNSSIVNVESSNAGDEDSCLNPFFSFDVLKSNGEVNDYGESENRGCGFVTNELFPVREGADVAI